MDRALASGAGCAGSIPARRNKKAKFKMQNAKLIISVIGGHKCTPKVEQIAHKLGKNIAKVGAILVCGGLSGVMEAIC